MSSIAAFLIERGFIEGRTYGNRACFEYEFECQTDSDPALINVTVAAERVSGENHIVFDYRCNSGKYLLSFIQARGYTCQEIQPFLDLITPLGENCSMTCDAGSTRLTEFHRVPDEVIVAVLDDFERVKTILRNLVQRLI